MFFRPPEVKAISRYSDFGSHLGPRSFCIMFGLALLLHAGLLGMYAMMPHSKVVNIPVRVMNINLGANMAEAVPASEQPPQESAHIEPAIKSVEDHSVPSQKAPQVELEKALAGEKKAEAAAAKKAAAREKAEEAKKTPKSAAIVMPKKYVREAAADAGKSKDKASQELANAKPEEMVQRYTQAISLWVTQHKIYPEEAKNRNAQGEAIVRVRINRQGHILYYVIEKSTGDAFLDHAAMSMVRASDPAPAVPENYPEGDVFEFLVPVAFTLEKK